MKNQSRTAKSIKNFTVSFVLYFVSYIVMIIGRTFFLKILGNEYLSVASLFSNVITLISFTELGIGTACTYCLYKPIANGDYEQINVLLAFLGKIYKIIAAVSFAIGIVLIPVLPLIVNMDEVGFGKQYLIMVYLFYIVNNALSYIYAERRLYIIASQNEYIVNAIHQIMHIVCIVVQTFLLYITDSFLLYLCIMSLMTFFTNVLIAIYLKKFDKRISLSDGRKRKLSNGQKDDLVINISSMFFYRVGAVALNGTDNILISMIVSTLLVGICQNYNVVIGAVSSLLTTCIGSFSASVGNLVAEQETGGIHVFKQLDLLVFLTYAFSTVCLAVLLNPFIEIWLGVDYLLTQDIVLALVMTFYVLGINQIPSQYRTAFGLFKKAKFFPLLAMVTNIILSIILGKFVGMVGIFLATSIVRLIYFTLVDSRLVYKHGFKASSVSYYISYVRRLVATFLIYFISYFVVREVAVDGIVGFTIKLAVCVIISLLTLLIYTYFFEDEWRKLLKRFDFLRSVFGFKKKEIK